VRYLRGLLAPLERKNGWTIAEHAGLHEPKALQRFLNLTPWDSDRLRVSIRRTRGITTTATYLNWANTYTPHGLTEHIRLRGGLLETQFEEI
jgi:hypothetical protein